MRGPGPARIEALASAFAPFHGFGQQTLIGSTTGLDLDALAPAIVAIIGPVPAMILAEHLLRLERGFL